MKYALVYYSTARFGLTEEEVSQILETARNANKRLYITGCLLLFRNEFLQILEGERETIVTLFERITKDSRHYNINLIYEGEISNRLFKNWDMAYCKVSDDNREELAGYLGMKEFYNNLEEIDASSSEAMEIFYYFSKSILGNQRA